MNRKDLEQIAGSRLSDARLIAAFLEDNFLLRGSIQDATEVIETAINALGLVPKERP